MKSNFTQRIARSTAFCLGSIFLALASVNVAAAEYKLYINDATACSRAGASGANCVIAVTGTGTATATTTTTTTTASATTTGSAAGCVVTSWNPCSNSSSSNATTTNTASTATITTVTASPSTTVTSTAPTPTSNASLDFGSGGTYATGNTNRISLSPGTTSFPFTTASASKYSGQVGIVPTSGRVPGDGSEVRMWISTAAGGAALAGRGCAKYVGFEGDIRWDQSGGRVFECQVPSNTKLYLNLALCISDNADTTCSAPGAKYGSESAPLYIWGTFSATN